MSAPIKTNIGSPQGCILSRLLFSIYTNDLKSCYSDLEGNKYADDTLIIGNIHNDDNLSLSLNESKTKEIIFDFRKNKKLPEKVIINIVMLN